MSQGQADRVDLCDNLPSPNDLSTQNQNLIKTHPLSQIHTITQTLNQSLSPTEEGDGHKLIQEISFNNNGEEEEEMAKKGYSQQHGEKDEDEENDEVMKEEEEDEESEGSSSLIRCQSPDTPMTDSSYSETGSLLETPYPLSPGTSPEPTSPNVPLGIPETAFPISPVELNQQDSEVGSTTVSGASTTGPITVVSELTCTTGPMDYNKLPTTSAAGHTSIARPTDFTEGTLTVERRLMDSPKGPLPTSMELVFNSELISNKGPVNSHLHPVISATGAGTSTSAACTTRQTTFSLGPISSTTQHMTFTTGPITTGKEPTFTTGAQTSPTEVITSTAVPTSISVATSDTGPTTSTSGAFYASISTSTTGHISIPSLMASLEQLEQMGDVTHLPQYLHQIAEAFVLQDDYQSALWCIQLERLYHQRILENLNTLQDQWESRCTTHISDLATQQLESLAYICQTHSRPSTRDSVCASLDFLKPSQSNEKRRDSPLSSCTSGHQTKRMEREWSDTDSSFPRGSQPVTSSTIWTDSRHTIENSENDKAEPVRELKGRAATSGNQLSDREEMEKYEEVEDRIEHTTSTRGTRTPLPAIEDMGGSTPSENWGQDIELTEKNSEKEEGEEEREVEEATHVLELKNEGEEKKEEDTDPSVCTKALPDEIQISEADVLVQPLHQEAWVVDYLYDTQLCHETQEVFMQESEHYEYREEGEYGLERLDLIREAASLDYQAKLITVEEMSPVFGLVSILKKRTVYTSASSGIQPSKPPKKRRVRFKFPDDGFEHDVGGGDSCLLLFLLCLVTVVISIGGTALFCALGDAHSSVCQDFSRNADFYITQMQRGIAQIQHWFTPGS